MEQPQIEIINNWNLSKFFHLLQEGEIKIPRFQRGYVWEKSKVVKLLNSIYSQYPIGSFFLWSAPQNYNLFVKEYPELELNTDKEHPVYHFILDGQQRISSLYAALKGKTIQGVDCKKIYFNLDKKRFYSSRGSNTVPAWKLFDPQAYGEILADYAIHDRSFNTNYASIWRECNEIFTNYPLSIVRTLKEDIEDVVEIFERINQSGKRLTVYDIVHATTYSEDFDLSANVELFNETINSKSLGEIPNKVFIAALTINSFGNFTNALQMKLTSEMCLKVWKRTYEAFDASVKFITRLGIKEDLTPYHNLLPVLQYYFFKTRHKKVLDIHKADMEKWFWDAKFSNRFSGSSNAELKKDIAWINDMV